MEASLGGRRLEYANKNRRGPDPLVAEVVWSTVNDLGTAQIGLTLVGVNAKERQLIFELMVQTMNESTAS